MPWLSIVMPAYRGERWIATALESLTAQAMSGVEILLVDGGPSSATVDIARRYCDRLRLRIFERPDLVSWLTKTNFAVSEAEAPHICWLGVDDVWLPGRAQSVHAWIEAAPAVPLHLAASVIIDNEGTHLGLWRCPLPPDRLLPSTLVKERLLVQNFVAAPGPVFRRDAWLSCGGLDEGLWYCGDWDIWLKLAGTGPVLYHDAPSVGFRIHRDALTMSGSYDAAELEHQLLTVLERHTGTAAFHNSAVAKTAHTSVIVNRALSSAAVGDLTGLPRAAWSILRLGPRGIRDYFRDSRLWERTLPRMRAKLRSRL